MITRRNFLGLVGALIAASALPVWAAGPAKRPSQRPTPPKHPYTQKVRAVTKPMKIKRGRWKMIVGHHSALKQGNAATYDRVHRDRGMENGLAYHFLIGNGAGSGDGEIEIGSRWLRQIKGGHVKDDAINEIAIGICLVGNFEEDKPTTKQMAAFCELVDYLRAEVTGRKVKFTVHKELPNNATLCPGKNFPTAAMHKRYG